MFLRRDFFPNLLNTFFSSTILLSLCFPVALAQCSQATRPAPAFSAERTTSLPSDLSVDAGEESSSLSGTANSLHFKTGSAITVLENTALQVVTDSPISSRTTKAGARLAFTVTRDVVVNGILVIPCGARVYGTMVSAKQSGRLTGASSLTLGLTELDLDGRNYALYTPPFKVVGQSKTRPTVNKVVTGAAVGTLVMDSTMPAWSRKPSPSELAKGDAVIAGMGAGVGVAIAASSPPSIAMIPAESQLEFTLTSPIAVFPVDQRAASRLAQGMHRGGPSLYIRGESQ